MQRIALSMRVVEAPGTKEIQNALAVDWINWLEAAGTMPVLTPNGLDDPASFINALAPDLVILTGGGERGQSPDRDRLEDICFQRACDTSTPLLGVCRGLQVINLLCGGRIEATQGHTAVSHDIDIEPAWQEIYGARVSVNSYHDLGIPGGGLADDLEVAAKDKNGGIEAGYHRELPIAGVMWHPERGGAPTQDRALMEALTTQGAFWC